jgi:diguanylate cyclase (GGDEF)-like protein
MTNEVVLLIDDSSVIRAVVRRRLEEQGYTVVEVEDSGGALAAFRACRPDVVLLDIEMPVLDGFQILKLIKAEGDQADTPVVFLTARDKTEDLVEALRMGAHDYLRKPFEPAELTARVRAAVRVKTLQDELRVRNAELELVSRTDPLTGLWNRRHTEEQLQAAASLSRRHGTPFAVLMIDVDHFKRVNDRHGHLAGDEVLREVARRMAGAVRGSDVTARFGGEEFVILLPRTGYEAGRVLAERIRRAVADETVRVTGAVEPLSVTVSIGVAEHCTRTDGEDLERAGEQLLARADAALYDAKAGGRNSVALAANG